MNFANAMAAPGARPQMAYVMIAKSLQAGQGRLAKLERREGRVYVMAKKKEATHHHAHTKHAKVVDHPEPEPEVEPKDDEDDRKEEPEPEPEEDEPAESKAALRERLAMEEAARHHPIEQLEKKVGLMRTELGQYRQDLIFWRNAHGSEYPQRRLLELDAKLVEIDQL
jgi:hypothetical protein